MDAREAANHITEALSQRLPSCRVVQGRSTKGYETYHVSQTVRQEETVVMYCKDRAFLVVVIEQKE